jgi:hypothetical protein
MKLSLLVVIALAGAGVAQKANFSGTWEIDQKATDAASPPKMTRGGTMVGVTGVPLTITQTADAFAIERRGGDGGATVTTAYKLDGVERDVTTSQGTVKAKARWDGEKIVTETSRGVTTYSIDASGILWVEAKTEQGTTKRAYRKSSG